VETTKNLFDLDRLSAVARLETHPLEAWALIGVAVIFGLLFAKFFQNWAVREQYGAFAEKPAQKPKQDDTESQNKAA
jgi:hypothetical protein